MNYSNVEVYLKRKYTFKYNEVLNRTFFKKNSGGSSSLKLLDDYYLNSMYRELSNKNLKIGKAALRDLLQSDFVPRFNPIMDYFKNLKTWDGSNDFITSLACTVNSTDNKVFQWAFKKWFVAMIGCAYSQNITNHCALILIGPQGLGKSSWIQGLLPIELKDYLSSGKVDPTRKDSVFLLAECMLINLEEVGTFSRSEAEAFKEIITKEVIRERRPYGVFAENYVRRASFIGSSNNQKILVDVTGNRRFLVFEISGFKKIDSQLLDNAYSQGFYLFKKNFQYWFDQKDIQKINKHNEQYREVLQEEVLLSKYFLPVFTKGKGVLFMNATETINYISNYEKSTVILKALSPVEMGKVLKAKGFKELKVKGVKKYMLKRK
ncbi:VapE domain-containing protein [Mangrovimonas sp. TPBH4]|uniref:VapE domain-containing protein n=1 Tax=Mangrovimonas sp. TPBH4 TaxID=1645914 RepID=UPI0006B54413|nr:VapE domain-containing protein [Mangrovimonas sp. TPBH4]